MSERDDSLSSQFQDHMITREVAKEIQEDSKYWHERVTLRNKFFPKDYGLSQKLDFLVETAHIHDHPDIECGPLIQEILNEVSNLTTKCARLEEALRRISNWTMPSTFPNGEYIHDSNCPSDCWYGWHMGSNGERDEIIRIAKAALEEK